MDYLMWRPAPWGGTRMSSLVNRAALKRYLLDRAKVMRPFHPLNRVSEEAIEHLENSLRNGAAEMIRRHPAKGSTIRP